MARTPFLERSGSLKVLGAAFLALLLFFVWLTYAFFNKQFVDSVPITLTTTRAGSNLPMNADVKLRGMIVGELREITPTADGVSMKLAMKPDLLDQIPAGVTARLVPKTLFGEKYIDLIPPAVATGRSLSANDVIAKAAVPIEVDQVLNDLYPVLEAVSPADLSYTLTAVSQALTGRGEKLGSSLVELNDYLAKINPDVPQLITDLSKFGNVSDQYAAAFPDVSRLLENLVVTGNTLVAKKAQLAGFFDEGTALADTLTAFAGANGKTIEELARQSVPVLAISSRYSNTFPCFLGGMAKQLPMLNSVFRDRMVHIDLKILATQPTGYRPSERATIPSQKVIDNTPEAQPDGGLKQVCSDLNQYMLGNDPLNGKIYPGPDKSVYKILGIDNSHNGKFGPESAFQRSAVGTWPGSLRDVDTRGQRDALKSLIALRGNSEVSEVPDLGALLLSPVVRGTEVSLREAR